MQTNSRVQMTIKAGKYIWGVGHVEKMNPENNQFPLKILEILFVWLANSLVYFGELLQCKIDTK